jgi:hypothetical protein
MQTMPLGLRTNRQCKDILTTTLQATLRRILAARL